MCQCSHPWEATLERSVLSTGTGLTELLHLRSRSPGDTDLTGVDGIDFILSVCFPWYRFINFYEAVKVNSAVIHLMGFLVLLATVQLWSLLYQNPRLQVIDRTLSKAWDEVVGFLLVILILLTGYAIAVSTRPSVSCPECCGLGVTLLSLKKVAKWKVTVQAGSVLEKIEEKSWF